jgi:elongator complex protein 3
MDFSSIDVADNRQLAKIILKEAVYKNVQDRKGFQKLRNRVTKQESGIIFHNLYFVKAYEDMVRSGELEENPTLLGLIKKRSVRTASGVAPVTVLTKAWPCPGKCVYCPTDVRMPKSYIATQPAAARGLRQKFDPYKQVVVRLRALEMTGHEVSKVELRIIGGTWSSYEKEYQTWFVKRCLEAMSDWKEHGMPRSLTRNNTGSTLSILDQDFPEEDVCDEEFEVEVKRNETAEVRCIGINIETRPDFIDVEEITRLRWLGVTKIEMGVQTTSDRVQELTMRGHDLQSVRDATRLMKDAGFKVSYHMMPNLPGSTPEQDVEDFEVLFTDSGYQPDYVKIYPCMVIPQTTLSAYMGKRGGTVKSRGSSEAGYKLRMDANIRIATSKDGVREQGSEERVFYSEDWKEILMSHEVYSDEVLTGILKEIKKIIPEYCRIDRLMRDIPADEIEEGSKVSNIRQIVQQDLLKEGFTCRCIRCREIGDLESHSSDVELVTREYMASEGKEVFLSYESKVLDKILGLLRLRLPSSGKHYNSQMTENNLLMFLPELSEAALVREVHVYGTQLGVGSSGTGGSSQHVGYGKRLMQVAEDRAKKAGYSRLAVIAGIGTRGYYKKLGYVLEGTYMVKEL